MKDNFSRQADMYAKYRPAYPDALFDFILSHVKHRNDAWDCATGNGQSAKTLARFFSRVYATDTSQKQIDHAWQADNIIYSRQPAEKTEFASSSFDLITVSQALHWLRYDEFYSEVKRVARPGAWLAAWMYSGVRITPEINRIIEKYNFQTLGTYWDSERKHVDSNYATIPFLPDSIASDAFSISGQWSLKDLEGYFNTWSALQKFIAENNYSPVHAVIDEIAPHWTNERMEITFAIHLRMAPVK
jgi:ubiquinone/menaquinone biosynthesis C-methylase UbiE